MTKIKLIKAQKISDGKKLNDYVPGDEVEVNDTQAIILIGAKIAEPVSKKKKKTVGPEETTQNNPVDEVK